MKTTVYIYGLITVVVLVTLYFALKRVGLIKSGPTEVDKVNKETAEEFRDEVSKYKRFKESKLFDPTYINKIPFATRGITETEAREIASNIYNAPGFFNDDEDAVYNAFQSIKKQSDVSMLAKIFKDDYEKDLRNFLTGFLNTGEIIKVWDIIQSK